MSRSDFDVISRYTGDGFTSAFSFGFLLESLSHLLVVFVNSSGVEISRERGNAPSLVLSVAFVTDTPGGTVTLVSNLANNYKIIILLANDLPTQPNQYRDKFDFTLRSFERALDFISGALQRVAWLMSRGLRLNDIDHGTFDTQLPGKIDQNPGATIAVNNTGNGFQFGPTLAELDQLVQSASDSAVSAAASEAAALAAQAAADAANLAATDAQAAALAAQAAAISAARFAPVGTYAAPLSLSDSSIISFDLSAGTRQIIFVIGNGGPVTNIKISNPSSVGDEILICGRDDINTVTMNNDGANGVFGNGDAVLKDKDIIHYVAISDTAWVANNRSR